MLTASAQGHGETSPCRSSSLIGGEGGGRGVTKFSEVTAGGGGSCLLTGCNGGGTAAGVNDADVTVSAAAPAEIGTILLCYGY
ncbi:unnamed protein product [Macrosiphum euphorbiae]|uniref:Uncharacterized protein n=1 Tax=Macrosiphum euphorbiae TaxID=13131 RepID=A0AAV0W5G4_9HEMI|nr:unnamed protein product [Macrosiphum euphorbiae]